MVQSSRLMQCINSRLIDKKHEFSWELHNNLQCREATFRDRVGYPATFYDNKNKISSLLTLKAQIFHTIFFSFRGRITSFRLLTPKVFLVKLHVHWLPIRLISKRHILFVPYEIRLFSKSHISLNFKGKIRLFMLLFI